MKTVWTSGLNAEKKEEIERDFISSSGMRERLTAILSDKITSKRSETLSKDLYNSPSWAYQQADAIGYERALNEVISLISSPRV